MERNYHEEFYEILDEMNSEIEGMVNEIDDQETLDLIIAKLSQKAKEFVDDIQHEIEKMELIEMEI